MAGSCNGVWPVRRIRSFIILVAVGAGGLLLAFLIPEGASAHRSGCHSAHTCPSDHHTYVWVDPSTGLAWDCAEAGAPEVGPSDTQVIVYDGRTYYCHAAGSPVSTTTAPTTTAATTTAVTSTVATTQPTTTAPPTTQATTTTATSTTGATTSSSTTTAATTPTAPSRPLKPPKGATARCRDGIFSFSKHRRGTCSHHGGVAVWLKTLPP